MAISTWMCSTSLRTKLTSKVLPLRSAPSTRTSTNSTISTRTMLCTTLKTAKNQMRLINYPFPILFLSSILMVIVSLTCCWPELTLKQGSPMPKSTFKSTKMGNKCIVSTVVKERLFFQTRRKFHWLKSLTSTEMVCSIWFTRGLKLRTSWFCTIKFRAWMRSRSSCAILAVALIAKSSPIILTKLQTKLLCTRSIDSLPSWRPHSQNYQAV